MLLCERDSGMPTRKPPIFWPGDAVQCSHGDGYAEYDAHKIRRTSMCRTVYCIRLCAVEKGHFILINCD